MADAPKQSPPRGGQAERPPGPSRWLRSVAGLLALCFRHNPGWSLGAIALMGLLGLLPIGQIFIVQGLFNSLAAMIQASGDLPFNQLLQWLLLFAGLIAILNLLFNLIPVLQAGYREANRQSLWQALLGRLEQTSPIAYEHLSFHNQLSRAKEALNRVIEPWSDSFLWFCQTVVMVVATSVVFLSVHWAVLVTSLVGGLLQLVLETFTQGRQYQLFHGQTPGHRREAYLFALLTQKRSLRELLLFGAVDRLQGSWLEQVRGLWRQRWRLEKRNAFWLLWGRVLLAGQALFSLGLLAHLYQAGRLDVGLLAGVLTALGTYQQAIGMFVMGLAGWLGQAIHATDLVELLSRPLGTPAPEGQAEPGPAAGPGGLAVALHEVSFKYPGASRFALEGINLRLAPGERLAIIGENGSGKTTLAHVLLGLYPPTAGQVTHGGVAPAAVAPGVRSAVFQYFVQYWLTVRQNIGFGFLPALADDGALLASAGVAGVGGLPLDTPLGKPFGGTELSGGNWQRLALARGLLAPSRLVVLDEVTAKLDPAAEANLLGRLDAALADRTVVFIAHRLPLVRLADRIIVMKGGRIIEAGTHDELLALGGAYARFYSAQASWYQEAEA